MNDALPLKIDGKALKVPRAKPARGKVRPVWTDYVVKTPVRCDHCVLVAYDALQDGAGFDGIRTARRKRKQGADILLLCSEHAIAQKAVDDVDYAGTTDGNARTSGQRFIA